MTRHKIIQDILESWSGNDGVYLERALGVDGNETDGMEIIETRLEGDKILFICERDNDETIRKLDIEIQVKVLGDETVDVEYESGYVADYADGRPYYEKSRVSS